MNLRKFAKSTLLGAVVWLISAQVAYAQITGPSTVTNLDSIVGNVLQIVYSFLGVALFGYFLYGGYLWLSSTGEPDKIKKAMDTMLHAAIGAGIVVFAYVGTRIVGGIVGFDLYG